MKARKFASIALAILICSNASAATITVVSTVGVRGFLEQVRQSFEQVSGDRLDVKYGTAAVLRRNLNAREFFDVVILTNAMIDELVTQGKVMKSSSRIVARTAMGIAARAGTVRPSVGTPNALRSVLLGSSRIAYTRVGHSAAAAARLFNGLGITTEMKDRIYLDTRPAGGVLAVAEGRAPLGIALLSEIAADPRVELVAPFPNDLQTYIRFAAATAVDTKEPEACRSFIAFLRKADVRLKLYGVGMEGE